MTHHVECVAILEPDVALQLATADDDSPARLRRVAITDVRPAADRARHRLAACRLGRIVLTRHQAARLTRDADVVRYLDVKINGGRSRR